MLAHWITRIDRHSDRVLIALVIILLTLGTAYAIHLGNTIRFYPDECDYVDLARYLVNHGQYTIDGIHPTAYRPPGYPVYLAVAAFLGGSVISFRIMNYLALAVVMYCVYKILKEHTSPLAASLGALIVIGYPLAFYTAGTLYPQILAACMLLLALSFFTRRAMKLRDYFLSGLFLAGLILVTPVYTFVLGVFTLWLLFNPTRRSLNGLLVMIVPIVLLIGVWTARNYHVFNAVFFVSTNSGENLLIGNSENSTPNSGRLVDISQYRAEAVSLGEVARNRFFETKALEFMATHKVQTVRIYVLKLLNYFNIRNNLKTRGMASSLNDLAMLLTYGPLLLLGIIRLVSIKRDKLDKLSKPDILVALLYLTNAFVSALFFTRIRFRLPADFLLILLAAPVLDSYIRRRFIHA